MNNELIPDNDNVPDLRELKIIILDPQLPMPMRAHDYDAGIDLYIREDITISPGERVLVGTGIAVDIPPYFVGLIHPRSGLAWKHGLSIVNAPGTIDTGYQGEIKICLINLDSHNDIVLRRADRIAQLVIQRVELPRIQVVDSFTNQSQRGDQGYGSTGGHSSL